MKFFSFIHESYGTGLMDKVVKIEKKGNCFCRKSLLAAAVKFGRIPPFIPLLSLLPLGEGRMNRRVIVNGTESNRNDEGIVDPRSAASGTGQTLCTKSDSRRGRVDCAGGARRFSCRRKPRLQDEPA